MNRPICIIDDDDDIREVMSFALEFEDMKSLVFDSAKKAEEVLSKLPEDKLPCLLIVDYMMPDMDGVEFIKRLNSKYPDTLAKIPVALSTGFLSDEILGLPSSILRLEKPIDLQDFLVLAKQHYHVPEKPYSLF